MKKLITGFFSFLFTALLVLLIISSLYNATNDRAELEIKEGETSSVNKKIKIAFPVFATSSYNYRLIKQQFNLKHPYYMTLNAGEIKALGIRSFSIHISNTGLFDRFNAKNEISLNKAIKEYTDYIAHVALNNNLTLTSIDLMDNNNSAVSYDKQFYYTNVNENKELLLIKQFEFAFALFNSFKVNTNECYPLVLNLGVLSESFKKKYGNSRAYAKTVASSLILKTWKSFEEQHKANKLCIYIKNSYSKELSKETILPDISDLVTLRRQIINLNNAYGRPIKQISKRIKFAIDTSSLYSYYVDSVTKYDKREKSLIALKRFKASSYSTFEGYGVQRKSLIKLVYASYLNFDKQDFNLPFNVKINSRNEVERLKNQLRFISEVYRTSNNAEKSGATIILSILRRENMPLLHSFFRPFLSTQKHKGFYIKDNGSVLEDQKISTAYLMQILMREPKGNK